MERVRLGRTEIKVSKLGIGSGSEHPSAPSAQSLMSKAELAGLLLYAFERGINFWDTALRYETHAHFREALKYVKRHDVVITTKIVSSQPEETLHKFHTALNELGVDYVDVCFVHGVETEHELQSRRGALDTLLECKEAGKIRAVGISAHGLSALKAVTKLAEIDVVLARINFAGLCMDSPDLGLVEKTLRSIHVQSKGVVGMKLIANGQLRDQARQALRYVKGLPFVDAFVVGMLRKEEIEENCRTIEESVSKS